MKKPIKFEELNESNKLLNFFIIEELIERYQPCLEVIKNFILAAKKLNMPSDEFEMRKADVLQDTIYGLKQVGYSEDVIDEFIQYTKKVWSKIQSELDLEIN